MVSEVAIGESTDGALSEPSDSEEKSIVGGSLQAFSWLGFADSDGSMGDMFISTDSWALPGMCVFEMWTLNDSIVE